MKLKEILILAASVVGLLGLLCVYSLTIRTAHDLKRLNDALQRSAGDIGPRFTSMTGRAADPITWVGDDSTFPGTLTIPDFIYHTGDLNTYWKFEPDAIFMAVGGDTVLEFATTQTTIGSTTADINTAVRGNSKSAYFYDWGVDEHWWLGSKFGFGTNVPTKYFSVASNFGEDAYFFFDNADVADTENGQSMYVYRRSAEGDDYLRFYVNQFQEPQIFSTGNMLLQSATGKYIYISSGANIFFQLAAAKDFIVRNNALDTIFNIAEATGFISNPSGAALDIADSVTFGDGGTTDYMAVSATGDVSYIGSATVTGAKISVVAKTDTYTATLTDDVITCGAGNQSLTIILPTAASAINHVYHIKNEGTGTISVDADSTETIDGAETQVMAAQYDSLMIISDGTVWWIL